MTYFPSSQIKSDQYTNGNEFILFTTKEFYKGYYYIISNGSKYTGKNPQDGSNILLTNPPNFTTDSQTEGDIWGSIIPSFLITEYSPPSKIIHRIIPPSNPNIPTQKDYELGRFIRYFAKKNNENIYLEINKETYDQLKSRQSTIAWDLYSPINIIWTLTGVEDKVFLTNKNIVSLAERDNKWYGFTQWFKDNFLKYYLAS